MVDGSNAAKKAATDTDGGDKKPGHADKKKRFGDKKHAGDKKPAVPQSHKEQKELRTKRKEEDNPNHSLVVRMKELWEQLRQKKGTEATRAEAVEEICALVHGKAKEVIFQHDSARIIQSAIKYGTIEQRAKLFGDLKGAAKHRFVHYCSSSSRSLPQAFFWCRLPFVAVTPCLIGCDCARPGACDASADHIVDLCKSKYSRHVIPKLLQYS